MLRDNIKLILSLAQLSIDLSAASKDKDVLQSAVECQDTLDYVKMALDDIQHDNYGQFVIYTGLFDKEHWGYEAEDK
jgi:hypothetical protein